MTSDNDQSSEANQDPNASADSSTAPAVAESTQDCIVVVEDSPPNRKILCHLLDKLGYDVISCEDGKVAMEQLQADNCPNVVAILSDIMMPNMNGLDLLKFARESDKYKDIPFVLITAVSDKEYIVEAKSLNVNGYILKPVTFHRVTSKLEELFPTKKFPKLAS